MTLGFRKLEEMTDIDLAVLIDQLVELGAIEADDLEGGED